MLDIIQNNPYRLLGIYSNSPTKERVANHNRLKAFLKVGKEVSFPLDFPSILPSIIRKEEAVQEADAKLTLPKDQLRYAQFWFVKVSHIDDIAINHLIAGNINIAIFVWEKKDDASSLQNRIICALLREDYASAFTLAYHLYTTFADDFAEIILGKNHTVTIENLGHVFLDELCSAIGAKNILPYLSNNDWIQYVGNKTIKPLMDTLLAAVNTAKASKGKGISARYNAGVKLMNDTKTSLSQLKSLLPANDLQYQMIADKIGLEILQCGIDYYNASEAADAAHKAMKLQSYAMSVVVGKMAKDRCKENVDILKEIIANLPPMEVMTEDKAIKEELRKFCQLPDKICHAITLLNNTKSHLQSIKAKLGVGNTYYLKLSTQVVGNALHNIIEEVNDVQNEQTIEIQGRQIPISMLLDRDAKIAEIKKVLQAACNATVIMDEFDMESDFKTNRYNQNRSILKDLCGQMGISTSKYAHVQRPTTQRTPTPRINARPSVSSQNVAPKKSVTDNKSSNDDSGCIVSIIFGVGVSLGAYLGGAVAGNVGAVLGIFVGLFIVGIVYDKIEKNL